MNIDLNTREHCTILAALSLYRKWLKNDEVPQWLYDISTDESKVIRLDRSEIKALIERMKTRAYPRCQAREGGDPQGYICTLALGHPGDHRAMGTNHQICAEWRRENDIG